MAETIELDCPGCEQTLQIDAGFIGGVCRCSHCGAVIAVNHDATGSQRAARRPDSPSAGGSTSGSDFDRISVVSARPGSGGESSSSASASQRSMSRSRSEQREKSPLPMLLGLAGGAAFLLLLVVVLIIALASGGEPKPSEGSVDNQAIPKGTGSLHADAENPWEAPAESEVATQAAEPVDGIEVDEPKEQVMELAPIPDGLSLRAGWEFNGTAHDSAKRDSPINGISTNGATVGDRYLTLDGEDDYVQIRVDPALNNIGKRMRVDIRFRAHEPGRPGVKQVLFESGGGERGYNVYLYNNRIFCGGYSRFGEGESNWQGTWIRSSGIRANQWHVITMQMDAGEKPTADALTMILDGREIDSAIGARIWNNAGRNMIGAVQENIRFHDGVSRERHPFKGDIDFIRVYGE